MRVAPMLHNATRRHSDRIGLRGCWRNAVDTKLALPVKCDTCFEEVQAELRVHNFEQTIFVMECARCAVQSEKGAFDRGYDEGYAIGHDNGELNAREEMKDDVRQA